MSILAQPSPEDLPEAFSARSREAFMIAVEVDPELIAWVQREDGSWVNQWGATADAEMVAAYADVVVS